MRFELRAKKISERVSCPELEEALLKGQADLIPLEKCLHWPGYKTRGGIQKKMVRDHNMRPEIVPVRTQPFPKVKIDKKQVYLHRWVFEKTRGLPERGRLRNFCGDTLCINPFHWVSTEIPEEQEQESEQEPPEYTDEWSMEDAVMLVEMFLADNSKIDRENDLLCDMPEEILQAALIQLNKEHLI